MGSPFISKRKEVRFRLVEYDFMYEKRRLRDFDFMMAKPEDEDSFGLSREIVKGDTNTSRAIANHYGSSYSDVLTLPFFIVKDPCVTDDLTINRYELRAIQAWLTSAKTPRQLVIETFDHDVVEYLGMFTDAVPFECCGLSGIYLTFTCDSSYAYGSRKIKVNGGEERNFACDSDELEDVVYPVISINPNSVGTFTITNAAISKSMTITVSEQYEKIVIDCKNKRIVADGKNLFMSDVGWDMNEMLDHNDVNSGVFDLFWMRLLPGNNKLLFSGDATFSVECKVPMKIGGFIDV